MERGEWLQWRHKGIGGSDAPVIMGDSPHKTVLELYEEKILSQPFDSPGNFVTDRGNEFEPKIRAMWNMLKGKNFEPALCESKIYPYLKCSLDGRHGEDIIEIKTASRDDHEGVKNGKVPQKYYAQVQHNLYVSNAKFCFYLSYYDPEWNKTVKLEFLEVKVVAPDTKYINDMLEKEKKFWECVVNKKPPKESDRDYKKLRGDGINQKLMKWKMLKAKIEGLEGEISSLREEILQIAKDAKHPRLICGNVRIRQEEKQGSVDYSKIDVLKTLDLNQYRKPSIQYWKMEVIDDNSSKNDN